MTRNFRVLRAALGLAGAAALITALAACSTAAPTPTPAPTLTPTPTPVQVTPGVTDDHVLFGQSVALSGPTRELGEQVRLGIEAAFKEANDNGGVHGRRLDLLTLDDGYEPVAAIRNTVELIEEARVFALIGAVGTPTSRAAAPVALEAGVPYIAPFTGAAFLRSSEMTNVLNVRASYAQEVEVMVERLTADLGVTRIGVMYQNDSFGRDGYEGVRDALARRAMKPVAIGTYPRNTTAVKRGILNLLEGAPEAVVIIGAYEPVAATLKWASQSGPNAIFLTVSFVGGESLARALSEDTEIYVTQVVPYPTDTSFPVVSSYQQALSSVSPTAPPSHVSLEGYLMGRLAIQAVEQCGQTLDRSCFVDGLRESGEFEIDGFRLSYDDAAWDNQGSDQVYMTVLDGSGAGLRQVENLRNAKPIGAAAGGASE